MSFFTSDALSGHHKLHMTDAKQTFIGYECKLINDLTIWFLVGFKVAIHNATIVAGMLSLDPCWFSILRGNINAPLLGAVPKAIEKFR